MLQLNLQGNKKIAGELAKAIKKDYPHVYKYIYSDGYSDGVLDEQLYQLAGEVNHESNTDLEEFVKEQNHNDLYETALREIIKGKKESHWIWFVFPQALGLGKSELSKKFGLTIEDVPCYLQHEVLNTRLEEVTTAVYDLEKGSVWKVFGGDAKKVRSCMTLFANYIEHGALAIVGGEKYKYPNIYRKVLEKHFGNTECKYTIASYKHYADMKDETELIKE